MASKFRFELTSMAPSCPPPRMPNPLKFETLLEGDVGAINTIDVDGVRKLTAQSETQVS
jgi:hypothetical protein